MPLVMVGGQLSLGRPRPERVEAWRDGSGFVDGVRPGDAISIHWSWACDRLAARQLAELVRWTTREIGIANLTI